jgi:uncharacterized membrane protein
MKKKDNTENVYSTIAIIALFAWLISHYGLGYSGYFHLLLLVFVLGVIIKIYTHQKYYR